MRCNNCGNTETGDFTGRGYSYYTEEVSYTASFRLEEDGTFYEVLGEEDRETEQSLFENSEVNEIECDRCSSTDIDTEYIAEDDENNDQVTDGLSRMDINNKKLLEEVENAENN